MLQTMKFQWKDLQLQVIYWWTYPVADMPIFTCNISIWFTMRFYLQYFNMVHHEVHHDSIWLTHNGHLQSVFLKHLGSKSWDAEDFLAQL